MANEVIHRNSSNQDVARLLDETFQSTYRERMEQTTASGHCSEISYRHAFKNRLVRYWKDKLIWEVRNLQLIATKSTHNE